MSTKQDLTDQVRKFTDDDFRAAVALLERLDFDVAATVQLVIVTDSFRGLLGLNSAREEIHGDGVKTS